MKADRLMSIVMLLTEKKLMSATQLANMLEVSPRTIYRDIDTLSMAGIPIYTTTGKYGGVGILDSYKIDKQLLNVHEISTLLIGLNSLNKVLPNQSLINTKIKIKNLIDQQHHQEINDLNHQIKIDPSPWNGSNSITEVFSNLQDAQKQLRRVRFTYSDKMGTSTQREVEPYQLLFKGSHWYLQAYCIDRRDFRTFMLQRMSNVELLEATYTLREIPMGEKPFQDDQVTLVKLCVNERLLNKLQSQYGKNFTHTQTHQGHIVQIPLPLNEVGYRYILGFGDDCECLEPLELREMMMKMVKNLHTLYKISTQNENENRHDSDAF